MDPVEIRLDAVYVPSDDIVAREIEGEVIIVPLTGGIGDMDDELFSFNQTGKAVWDKLDGERTVTQVVDELTGEYDADRVEVEPDVLGLLNELLKRKIVVER